jgi:hypothetical protein
MAAMRLGLAHWHPIGKAVRGMSVENKATQLGRANEAGDASGPIQLSDTTPARLIQSTGNLYWSSNPWVIEIQADEAAAYWTWGYVQKDTF